MDILNNSTKAIYLQIADRLSGEIAKGVYPPGERVPSVREYAATLQVNSNTVVRAYDLLSEQGIIYNRRGVGFFAADDAAEIIRRDKIERFYNSEINVIFAHLADLGIDPDTFCNDYKKYLKNQQQ